MKIWLKYNWNIIKSSLKYHGNIIKILLKYHWIIMENTRCCGHVGSKCVTYVPFIICETYVLLFRMGDIDWFGHDTLFRYCQYHFLLRPTPSDYTCVYMFCGCTGHRCAQRMRHSTKENKCSSPMMSRCFLQWMVSFNDWFVLAQPFTTLFGLLNIF